MSRYARTAGFSYSFGPGPMTPAVKWIIYINIGVFLLSLVLPPSHYFGVFPNGIIEDGRITDPLNYCFGLIPKNVIAHGWIWQPVTYMFLHGGIFHILFNMLGIWMFGVELERMWGTRFFVRYYAVTGVGAAVTVLGVALLPFAATTPSYLAVTIGASGALFGLLLAFAMYFPERPILMFMLFPVPAKYFVIIIGAIAFLSGPNSTVSNTAHLGGMLFGYLYLRNGRGGMTAEIKYRYLKWKMNRLRRKFDVYSGGRSDWDRKVH